MEFPRSSDHRLEWHNERADCSLECRVARLWIRGLSMASRIIAVLEIVKGISVAEFQPY